MHFVRQSKLAYSEGGEPTGAHGECNAFAGRERTRDGLLLRRCSTGRATSELARAGGRVGGPETHPATLSRVEAPHLSRQGALRRPPSSPCAQDLPPAGLPGTRGSLRIPGRRRTPCRAALPLSRFWIAGCRVGFSCRSRRLASPASSHCSSAPSDPGSMAASARSGSPPGKWPREQPPPTARSRHPARPRTGQRGTLRLLAPVRTSSSSMNSATRATPLMSSVCQRWVPPFGTPPFSQVQFRNVR
jgi:hypothetical protein